MRPSSFSCLNQVLYHGNEQLDAIDTVTKCKRPSSLSDKNVFSYRKSKIKVLSNLSPESPWILDSLLPNEFLWSCVSLGIQIPTFCVCWGRGATYLSAMYVQEDVGHLHKGQSRKYVVFLYCFHHIALRPVN